MILHTLLGKIKRRLAVYKNYAALKRRAKANTWAVSAPSVLFQLTDLRHEPYYFPLVFSLHESGYNVCIADNVKFIGNAFGPGRFIYEMSRVVIGTNPAVPVDLLITDSRKVFGASHRCRKKVLLVPETPGARGSHKKILPFPMQANAYHFRYFEKLERLRGQKRKSRILFSGNTDVQAYSNPIIEKVHGKLNRVEVINALLQHLDGTELRAVRKPEDLPRGEGAYFPGALIYLWQWSPTASQSLNIRVPNDEWHDFLATGDFFLCCPGIVIPQSYNAIEAMSVGTIPILQYAEYFHPPLQHRVNCIIFSDREDLIRKIREVIMLDDDTISRMRKNVAEYFDQHLDHTCVAKMLENAPAGDSELRFYHEVMA